MTEMTREQSRFVVFKDIKFANNRVRLEKNHKFCFISVIFNLNIICLDLKKIITNA